MEKIGVSTHKRYELVDITGEINKVVKKSGIKSGIVNVFIPHTTAGVSINENADADVKRDILAALERAVPNSGFFHFEGNSDAHTKALLTGFSVNVIFEDSRLLLGTWQSIYFCEYDGPRQRTVYIKIIKSDD